MVALLVCGMEVSMPVRHRVWRWPRGPLLCRVDPLDEEVGLGDCLGPWGSGRLFYRGIFLRFSSFQSASGLTAAALAIDLSGRMSSGR